MFKELIGSKVYINEMVARDGLQIESRFVPTEEKIKLIDQLSETGLNKIEVTSFVSPKAVPNMRDAKEVMAGIKRNNKVSYVALVPNIKGAENALKSAVDEINLVMSIEETHNLKNMRMTCEDSLTQFREILKLTKNSDVKVNGSVSTAFGGPFEGIQPVERVLWAVEKYLGMGMDSVTLADTSGMANPAQVYQYVEAVRREFPGIDMAMHFHDTRGMGLSNVVASLLAGATSFDASLGGLGGCPYAPGATGNICTEDTVHMLESWGVDTGVDLPGLMKISKQLPDVVGHSVPGYVIKAGTIGELVESLSQKSVTF